MSTNLSDFINGADNASWMADGLCVDADNPDAWFPHPKHEAAAAKKLCAGCPVRAKCAAFAVADSTLEGIWGGTTFGQRDWLRRKARDAA